eukprot:1158016-Pelagomonas_calceolata.AAC.6
MGIAAGGPMAVKPQALRRDEALAEIQNAIREQQQQELNIQAEIAGYKRDIVKQQIQNEQVMAVLRKVEGEAGHVAKNIEGGSNINKACAPVVPYFKGGISRTSSRAQDQGTGAVEKQERLQEVLLKLTRSLAHTEEQIKRVQAEAKAVNTEQAAIGRAHTKVMETVILLQSACASFARLEGCSCSAAQLGALADLCPAFQSLQGPILALEPMCQNWHYEAVQEIRQLEDSMVMTLGDQTTAEKSTRECLGKLEDKSLLTQLHEPWELN